MRKIKLTESQVLMLKALDRPKKLKITENQLIKIKEQIRLDESIIEESVTFDLLTYAQQLIIFIKSLLSDQSENGLSTIFVKLGISRGELLGLLSDFGIITLASAGAIHVIRKNIIGNVKRLSQFLKEKEGQNTSDETNTTQDVAVDEEYDEPNGASTDPRNPALQSNDEPARKPIKIEFKLVGNNNEIAILEDNNSFYFFYFEHLDKSEFMDGQGNIDDYSIEYFINSNLKNIKIGEGIDAYESGNYDLVKIDSAVKSEILNTWKSAKLSEILLSIKDNNVDEMTSAGGSSGAFVGALDNSNSEEISEDNIEEAKPSKLNQKDYRFYVVDRKIKKIYGGNTYREDANDLKREILGQFPEKELGVYTLSFLLSNKLNPINPNDNNSWANPSEGGLDESTTAAGSSGSYVQPKIWAKDKNNINPILRRPMFPGGKITDIGKKNENDVEGINEDAFNKSQYPDGKMVGFNDCVKYNNKPNNGGCSDGAVDNVVKTKTSVIKPEINESLYLEVAKKTGKTIDEVKTILSKLD
jgi:hypothetical protein